MMYTAECESGRQVAGLHIWMKNDDWFYTVIADIGSCISPQPLVMVPEAMRSCHGCFRWRGVGSGCISKCQDLSRRLQCEHCHVIACHLHARALTPYIIVDTTICPVEREPHALHPETRLHWGRIIAGAGVTAARSSVSGSFCCTYTLHTTPASSSTDLVYCFFCFLDTQHFATAILGLLTFTFTSGTRLPFSTSHRFNLSKQAANMVRTRHSLPNPDSTTSSDPLDGIDTSHLTERQKRDLRNLKIDANARLLSSSNHKAADSTASHPGAGNGEKRVYHYRGAVYEVQGTEPEDWLEEEEKWREAQEAKARAKKRKREEEEEVARKQQERLEEQRQARSSVAVEKQHHELFAERRRKGPAADHEQSRRVSGPHAAFQKPADYDSWPRKLTAEEDAHLRSTLRGYTSKQYSYRYNGSTDGDPIYGEIYARAKGRGWVKEAYRPEVVEEGSDKACLGLVGDLLRVQGEIGRVKGAMELLPKVVGREEGHGARRDSAAAGVVGQGVEEMGVARELEKVVEREKEKEVSRVDSAVEDEVSPAPTPVRKEDSGEGRAETELAAMRSAREGQRAGSGKDAVLAQLTENRIKRLDGLRRAREEEQLLRMFDG